MELQRKTGEESAMPHQELCPMCGVMQEMDLSAFRSTNVNASGETVAFVTVAYHCKSCGALARYEHIQKEADVAHAV